MSSKCRPGGALNVEKHMYEKVVFVVDGRGSTEVWSDPAKKQTFEWQKGSCFSIPLNASHRFVNATNSPALLYCGTTAPNVMNLFDNTNFIFNNHFNFTDRYSGNDDFFKSVEDVRARSGARPRDAPHELHPRSRQLRTAAR